jgi:hypothetical protein
MQIVLRLFVALLALAGAGGSAFLALGFNTVLTEADELSRQKLNGMTMAEASKLTKAAIAAKLTSPSDAALLDKAVDDYRRLVKVTWFFYVGAAFGVLGMLLAVCGKGKSAAVLLLVTAVGPVLFLYSVQPASGQLHILILVGIFIGALPVAGLLSLLVGPSRRRGPVREPEVD